MVAQRLIGHHRQRGWFANAIERQRLASTFLFVGPPGIGKRKFAGVLAQSLLCSNPAQTPMEPCGECENCIQVAAGTHPDVLTLAKPAERASIPVELLIGRREARMQEGLCHDIRLRPMAGPRRIAILDDCDALNQEGANALLKTLEEPPPRAVIILIGSSEQRQLPTIRSRCQIVRFDSPDPDESLDILRLHGGREDLPEAELRHVLELADGDLSRAIELLDEETRQFAAELERQLQRVPPEALALAKLVSGYVDAGGKEAAPRRLRLRTVGDLAAILFRHRLRRAAEAGDVTSTKVRSDIYRVQRCLEIPPQVDRNANQASLIESWAADLQRGAPL